jgi:FkbM family methyltransferase
MNLGRVVKGMPKRTVRELVSSVVQKCPPLYRQINRLRKLCLHEPTVRLKYRFLGSSYGGWGVPEDYLGPDSIVYTVGVGEDISFDLAVSASFDCQVFAFDPSPIAVAFIRKTQLPDNMAFFPIGLAARDGQEKFFAPQIQGFHSFSKEINPSEGNSREIFCEVLTLKSMMKRMHHTRIDMVKMDIEGFEYDVIDEMIASDTLPPCLLLEFHHKAYGIGVERTYEAVDRLISAGYGIFWVSPLGKEYGFFLADERSCDILRRNSAGSRSGIPAQEPRPAGSVPSTSD